MISELAGYFDNALFSEYIMEMEARGPFPAPTSLLALFVEDIQLDIDSGVIREMSHRPPVFAEN